MTLEQFITKYAGQYIGDGQCGSLVRQYWNEVEHITPPSYPSAKDYWYNPAPPYTHTSTPQTGDIAVYDAHGAFPDGHIAVVSGNEVFEQNADPDGSPAHLFTRANTYLLGYLTKESEMSTIGAEEARILVKDILGYTNENDIEAEIANIVGQPSNTVIRMLDSTEGAAAYKKQIVDGQTCLNNSGNPTVTVNGKVYVPKV